MKLLAHPTPLLLTLLLPGLLSGCGTLPQPFLGNPGPQGARLAVPPPPVLDIPTPTSALLNPPAAGLYARDLATALAASDVPSLAKPATPADWQLTTTAQANPAQGTITLHYLITGPNAKTYGSQNGTPVNATAWTSGNPQTLNTAATTDAASLTKLLAAVNASIQQSNPLSLENRPARIFFTGVTGAPSDGNQSLTLNMMRDLPPLGLQLTQSADQADFTLNGVVTAQAASPEAKQILLQINWIIHDSNNRKIGQVTQLHELNPADITPYWGDVAAAAATEGANGIKVAIQNATLHKPATTSAAALATAPSATAPSTTAPPAAPAALSATSSAAGITISKMP